MRLRYTALALADLASILDHIAENSPQGARRVHARIQVVLDLISQHPHIGTGTDDPIIRRMTVLPYPYLIFYEMTEDSIVIHAVRHAARDAAGMPGA